METMVRPDTDEALRLVAAGIDALTDVGLTPSSAAHARELIAGLETQVRRVQAAQIRLVEEIDRGGWHLPDGHTSAKVMVRHVARLSGTEADRRTKAARALRDLPAVAAAFAAGQIGPCQLHRIARAHANERVRDSLIANDGNLVDEASRRSFASFDRMLSAWVRLMDEDGTRDAAQRSHENRDAKIVQDFDGSWTISGGYGPLQGAELETIFKAFLAAEAAADWDAARAEHGDAATAADLSRTDSQRRADALFEIFQAAAAHRAASEGGSQVVTDVVIDHETFARVAARLAGDDPGPRDPLFAPFPSPSYRCETIDGRPLEPTEVVASALLGHIRRVVLGADGVVTDLGRKRRLFTGPAALAVKLSATECYWPGCQVPVSSCQCDHLLPWDHGGCTHPRNGGPACGRHNRLKTHGYRTRRDPTGTWHILRPDGTEIT